MLWQYFFLFKNLFPQKSHFFIFKSIATRNLKINISNISVSFTERSSYYINYNPKIFANITNKDDHEHQAHEPRPLQHLHSFARIPIPKLAEQ